MTLWNDLKNFFDSNSHIAEEAMHGGNPWGYEIIWGEAKGNYLVSDFEGWAVDRGVSKPELVDDYGGEDMGSIYYAVWKFTRGDETVFIKFFGYYASYNGADYEGFRQVSPKEVTKVEYV
jgi:hypothetical protein